MEFVRNRQRHDQTARQWTQLYAQPKPPLPPTPTTSPVPKQKGKRRDARRTLRSSTAASTSLVGDTITVDDSDDEERVDRDSRSRRPGRATGYKRTREGVIGLNSTEGAGDEDATNASRHIPCRPSVDRILDVDDFEETGSGSGHRHKRSRNGPGSSTTPQQSSEVIVIDD